MPKTPHWNSKPIAHWPIQSVHADVKRQTTINTFAALKVYFHASCFSPSSNIVAVILGANMNGPADKMEQNAITNR